MIVTPLGISANYCTEPYGYCCNLLEGKVLIDIGPQVVTALRRLRIDADSLTAALVTHFHPDHIFGFPFLLAERSYDTEKLIVIGPKGTKEKLTALCRLAYSPADPAKARFVELPVKKEGYAEMPDYRLRSLPMLHSDESIAYLIESTDRVTLGYSGDTAWCENLQKLLQESDAAMVEMTFIDEGSEDHLSLKNHLPLLLEDARPETRIILTHLSSSRENYLRELEKIRGSMSDAGTTNLADVEIAEEFSRYRIQLNPQ